MVLGISSAWTHKHPNSKGNQLGLNKHIKSIWQDIHSHVWMQSHTIAWEGLTAFANATELAVFHRSLTRMTSGNEKDNSWKWYSGSILITNFNVY